MKIKMILSIILTLCFCFFININANAQYFGNPEDISKSKDEFFAPIIYLVDLDNDRAVDVLIEDYYEIAYYKNDGNGSFDLKTIASVRSGSHVIYFVEATDINEDEKIDVVYYEDGEENGSFLSWIGPQSNGGFDKPQEIDENETNQQKVIDLNNDNKPDIIVTSYFSDKVAWYENKGDGKFSDLQPIHKNEYGGLSAYDLEIIDFDNDKDIDVISTIQTSNNPYTYQLTWYQKQEDDSFSKPKPIFTKVGGDIDIIAAIDLDNDEDIDILGSSNTDNNKLMWYKNDNGFSEKIIDKGISNAYPINLDGDQDIDLLTTSFENKLFCYENQGNGSFSEPEEIDTNIRAICSVDLDGDQDIDLLSASLDGKLFWYENQGKGSFSQSKEIDTNVDAIQIEAADIDNDQDNDIIVRTDNSNKIVWYENQIVGISSLSDNTGNGGDEITLFGQNFASNSEKDIIEIGGVKFPAAQVRNKNRELIFTIPETIPAGTYSFTVSTQTQTAQAPEKLTIEHNLVSFTPIEGEKDGIIMLNGTNFSKDKNSIEVLVGGKKAVVNEANPTQLKITVPDLPVGAYDIVVTINGVDKKPPSKFNVISLAPTITSISPSGALTPGREITITGTNFSQSGLKITIGGKTVSPIGTPTDNEIKVKVPELEDGSYDVTVSTSKDPSASKKITIATPTATDPMIESLNTTSGPPGSKVTITGKNFGTEKNLVKVFFSETEIPATNVNLINANEIQVTVPNLTPGSYNIKVTVDGKTSNAVAFTIAAAAKPTLSSIVPQKITKGSAEEITITGTSFGSDGNSITVKFTKTGSTPVSIPVSGVSGGTKITLDGSGLEVGMYTVSVAVNEISSETTLSFTVENAPVVDNTPPTLILSNNNHTDYTSGDVILDLKAIDEGSGIASVAFRSAGFAEILDGVSFSKERVTNTDGVNYSITLTATDFDETGLRYQFRATDNEGNSDTTKEKLIIRQYGAAHPKSIAGAWSPSAASGNVSVSDYQLIAIPFASQSVASVLEELGQQDETSWRLFQYGEDATKPWDTKERAQFIEYKTTGSFTSFDPGKGYFLIYRKPENEISLTGELPSSILANQSVTIQLQPGFNLIGNPYLFPIDWRQIRGTNSNIQSDLTLLNQGKSSNDFILPPFKGAFVWNSDQDNAVNIEIPISAKNGRYTQDENPKKLKPIHKATWEVPLRLESDDFSHHLSALGMHPEAHESADPLDDFTLPRFLEYLELNFYHLEFFMPKFSKDIVPTQNAYTWAFEVASNLRSQEVTLAWDNHYFGTNDKELMLLDLHNHQVINMREATAYTFSVIKGKRTFKVFFGNEATVKENMLPESIAIGEAYPNPMQDQFTIPVSLPKSESSYELQLEIYNITGQLVRRVKQTALPAGYQTLRWDRQNQERNTVRPGLYLYRINVDNKTILSNGRMVVQ